MVWLSGQDHSSESPWALLNTTALPRSLGGIEIRDGVGDGSELAQANAWVYIPPNACKLVMSKST